MRHFTQESTNYQYSDDLIHQMNIALSYMVGSTKFEDNYSKNKYINTVSDAILMDIEEGMDADDILNIIS
jgi:hypothetical protein